MFFFVVETTWRKQIRRNKNPGLMVYSYSSFFPYLAKTSPIFWKSVYGIWSKTFPFLQKLSQFAKNFPNFCKRRLGKFLNLTVLSTIRVIQVMVHDEQFISCHFWKNNIIICNKFSFSLFRVRWFSINLLKLVVAYLLRTCYCVLLYTVKCYVNRVLC